MSLGKFVLDMSIECIKAAREQGVENWLNGIVSDNDFKIAYTRDQDNRSNGFYAELVHKRQNLRDVE